MGSSKNISPFEDLLPEKMQSRRESILCKFVMLTVAIISLGFAINSLPQFAKALPGFIARQAVPPQTQGDQARPGIKLSSDSLPDFDWSSIEPSEELKWTQCYEKFDCARFSVCSLDYADPGAGKAAIALIRAPSSIPRDEPGYQGPLLFNPGGPGGSGVSLVLLAGASLRTILGEGFDLIGFDPRGVGSTTPEMSTFASQGESAMFILKIAETLNSSSTAFGAQYGHVQNLGDLAKARVENVAQYVGTPAVARDMLGIVKAHGYDKLQYWGFSYGTVLGATFAAMFPNNVGRLILDGVVDSEDYYKGLWANNLRDTDTGLQLVYQKCVDLGPQGCPMYDNSAEKIHDRVEAILERIKAYPFPFYNSRTGYYGSVDYSTVKRAMLIALYAPQILGRLLLMGLKELESGKPELPLIWGMSGRGLVQSMVTDACVCPASTDKGIVYGWEASLAIACGDAEPTASDIDAVKHYYDQLAEVSSFAECWGVRMACSGWKIRAKERFTASFETNTSYPLLFIGNTADPVTPLWNALKMSKGFTDSLVLTQDSPGHCSLAAPSLCTLKVVREYFQNGTLPEKGTVCDVQDGLSPNFEGLSAEDQQLLEASVELQKRYPVTIRF